MGVLSHPHLISSHTRVLFLLSYSRAQSVFSIHSCFLSHLIAYLPVFLCVLSPWWSPCCEVGCFGQRV
jgi:hypothetical protein